MTRRCSPDLSIPGTDVLNELTAQELAVLQMTAELFNALMALPDKHPSDADDFTRDIHAIQNRLMARLAVRAHPEFFRQPSPASNA